VVDYETANQADTQLFNKFFHNLLQEGIYWPPSQFEAIFVSLSHSNEDIRLTIEAVDRALNGLPVDPK
jgi:glutamate-1-semialdehyde 2,1-aminomutase